MVTRTVVPPTPYYYGARAELFRRNALAAFARGDLEVYLQQMQQCAKYTDLAMQLGFDEVYENHTKGAEAL